MNIFLREGLISLAAVVMAFGALDDITTDIARTFLVERMVLAACGGWFVFIAFRLWQQRRRLLAVVSLGMVGCAAWAQPFIGRGAGAFWYLATIAGLVWFVGISLFLMWCGWRKGSNQIA
jgi:hypothetical protein